MKSRFGLAALIVLGFIFPSALEQKKDLNVLLRESTFKIRVARKLGPGEEIPHGKFLLSEGTAFIVGRATTPHASHLTPVLITTKHLVENMEGDLASIIFRVKTKSGAFKILPYDFKLREQGQPLYQEHESADVIAMYLTLPKEVKLSLITMDLLGGDEQLEEFEIREGDTLLTLGFPVGTAATEAGFPSLQSGKIASYPITPAKLIKNFYLDYHVLPGNSGGPVYFSGTNRKFGRAEHSGETIQFIAGLVSQRTLPSPENKEKEPVLAVVVPAQFIKETIEMLPTPRKE